MIPFEKAQAYIKKHEKVALKKEDFNQFSSPYKIFGLLLSGLSDERRRQVNIDPFTEAFENAITVNPWTTKEGMSLGVFLFGEIQAPYLAVLWSMFDSLPYQNGYNRRAFRAKVNAQHLYNKINYFRRFLASNRTGYGALTLEEQFQYSTYFDNKHSYFFGAVLQYKSELVITVVKDILQAEDEIGGVSRDIIKGLLLTQKEECWVLVSQLLLAAQRQEGLRQTILESLDETSHGALKHIIGVILEHDLTRFSSVVRAVDTWFGFGWDAPKKATIKRILELSKSHILNLKDIDKLLKSKDNLEVYVGLWAIGLVDIDVANSKALELVYTTDKLDKKLLGLYFVSQTGRTNSTITDYFKKEFGKNPAVDYWMMINLPEIDIDENLFLSIQNVAEALPKDGKVYEGNVFSWHTFTVQSNFFYNFIINNATEDLLHLLGKQLDKLPSEVRETYMRKVFPNHYTYSFGSNYGNTKPTQLLLSEDAWRRTLAHQAIRDRNESVMATGIHVFYHMPLYQEDFNIVEELLGRKNKSLRAAMIKLLIIQPEDTVKTSTQNLIVAKNVDQRLAALEMLTLLDEKKQYPEFIKEQVSSYKERPKHTKNESVFLEKFSKTKIGYSFSNGFGAVNYSNLSPLYTPQLKFDDKKSFFNKLGITTANFKFRDFIDEPKIVTAVNNLIALVHEHRNHEYQFEAYDGETSTTLIANGIQEIKRIKEEVNPEVHLQNIPLASVWIQWYEESNLNDFELYSAIRYINRISAPYGNYETLEEFTKQYVPDLTQIKLAVPERSYYSTGSRYTKILKRLFNAYADRAAVLSFKLDLWEETIANFPEELKTSKFSYGKRYGHDNYHWIDVIDGLVCVINVEELKQFANEAQLKKYWDIKMFLVAQYIGYPKPITTISAATEKRNTNRGLVFPFIDISLLLFQKNLITEDDLLFQALNSSELMAILDDAQNYRKRNGSLNVNLIPNAIFNELKTNILAVELERGDLATEASAYISNIHKVEGIAYVFKVLQRMGKDTFERGYSYYGDTKKSKFSAILKMSIPNEIENYSDFVALADDANIPKKRLVELACYATQWAGFVGEYLGLEKLEDAVWWFQAHASDYMSSEKETIISRYSNIPKSDFAMGAIDIDWFNKVYKSIGKTNWKILHDAAKYITDGNGHRQVKLYSSVMLGEVKITETLKKITEKRDKDYVRTLGLIPLSKTIPEKDLLKRYNLLQQFLKESKQFGAQRQESEKNAVEIALDNLSRNAGFQDRVRFSWAMESKATIAIMENAVLTFDDAVIELVITDQGKTDLLVTKGDKKQKSIPAKYKKDKQVLALKEGKSYLSKQYSRTRLSLENAMVNEDEFTAAEIHKIMQHPIVKVMLSKLVLFSPERQISGFYTEGILTDTEGTKHSLQETDVLVIAHPSHLYNAVQWDLYQKYLFAERLVQPFKQVFRELYLVTKDEIELGSKSERYQGHQIQPQKTVALLRSRGWTVSNEDGLQKVYHKLGFMATMYAMADWYSPADIEAPTLEHISFHSLDTYKPIPLKEVPSVVFSEIMRDIDLVVSVAHVGGVDPEASHSTLQMRAALASESAQLFKLKNITVKERHILVRGTLGEYSIHLGSGQVSKNGLSLSILPVHSQHRGRMFLPFVDDDPKSAEIISKMKLLSEDNKIQDPTILAQINS
ncbi:conserved protein, with weak BamHI domain protein [Cellulophaga algicola DSM 14237]|uniref:Conserved protein, with weak BamHI domain protein n=1 Tax=Cellulophaga algicola (strain DSM 14237 / IC166 / ACAM 630) TaxID=688270 RepID=E6X4W1_CELAD|nr:DUF4132 domain-containing protein [Cellulophaga algicola]ADV50453.1 conserved protein, with weak BamHI domain protein [Cellulophaga algicola DSM 14237]